MSEACCGSTDLRPLLKKAKWALWFALVVNFLMFFIEVGASFAANSEALKADALDFMSDSFSYAVTLFVLQKSERVRDRSAALKGWLMTGLGLWVLGTAISRVWYGILPGAPVMGAIGLAALVANVAVAITLYQFRSHDLNMQSVWLCSRNDAIANVAVLLAAGGVWATTTRWPDLIVAAIISYLNLAAGLRVLISVRRKLGVVRG